MLFAPDTRPDTWDRRAARDALGIATADIDLSAVPVPAGATIYAVRSGFQCGVLTGPTDPAAAVAAWVADGWRVTTHDDNRVRTHGLTPCGVEATA